MALKVHPRRGGTKVNNVLSSDNRISLSKHVVKQRTVKGGRTLIFQPQSITVRYQLIRAISTRAKIIH